MENYDVYFNSGTASAVQYKQGDRVSLVEITNSDQDYYQNGTVIIYDAETEQTIGDNVQVYVNKKLLFDGYISRRQRLLKGVVEDNYQVVGKTYDLWRYHTDTATSYTNKTTTYIASSLVGSFCTEVSVSPDLDITDGINIQDKIEFDNEIVGDALIRLIGMDGFRFYVNNAGELVYESTEDLENYVYVTEPDIIEMQPLEEADEDLINDCLVVGGSAYSARTIQDEHDNSYYMLGDNYLYAQKFRADGAKLQAIKVYLGRTLDPLAPEDLTFEIWENTEKFIFIDPFDSWVYLNSGSSSYNMQISGGYLCLAHDGTNYKTSGCIESMCYSGSYTGEGAGYDCEFIKLGLTDVVSSNRIYISGTHDSGGSWVTLVDNVWYDFLDVDHSIKVRYLFSSNGSYTPKIGTAELRISDDSGTFEQEIITDDFTNSSNINVDKSDFFKLNTDYLEECAQISGLSWFTRYCDTGKGDSPGHLGPGAPLANCLSFDLVNGFTSLEHNDANAYDGDEATYAYTDDCGSDYKCCGYYYDFGDGPHWIYDMIDKKRSRYGDYISTVAEYVSGAGIPNESCDGWHQQFSNYIYSGVSRVLWVHKYRETYEDSRSEVYLYEIIARTLSGNSAGTWPKTKIQTTFVNTYPVNIEFLKVTLVTGGSTITISGSSDSGANWDKLTNGIYTQLTEPASGVIVQYWLDGSDFDYRYNPSTQITLPYIESSTIVGKHQLLTGKPKSGSRIEHSNNITFEWDDVAYPPSYSSWQTYSDPKLQLTYQNDYWLIFEAVSGSSKYWKYYTNSTSDYEYGGVARSWNDGYMWSTNLSNPTEVPAGDMRFQLGWSEGVVTATAVNQDSIDLYGRHFKKVTDSNITSTEEAQARADIEVSGATIPLKGSVTIKGDENIDLSYKLTLKLDNFVISQNIDIVSCTQTLDNKGFTTSISYGKQPFDIARKLAELERETL